MFPIYLRPGPDPACPSLENRRLNLCKTDKRGVGLDLGYESHIFLYPRRLGLALGLESGPRMSGPRKYQAQLVQYMNTSGMGLDPGCP